MGEREKNILVWAILATLGFAVVSALWYAHPREKVLTIEKPTERIVERVVDTEVAKLLRLEVEQLREELDRVRRAASERGTPRPSDRDEDATSLGAPKTMERRSYFTLGSTKEEVLAVQGQPSAITGETWHYDFSTVSFENGRVREYSNISRNLKIRVTDVRE